MRRVHRIGVRGLSGLVAGLMGACTPGAHSAATRAPTAAPPVLLAQATCWNTVSCCIQRDPTTAVERCGVTATELAEILNGARVVHEAVQAADAETAEAAAGKKGRLPAWKQECINTYNRCINGGWVGTRSCSDCLRYCEGQREWPTEWCFQEGSR